MTYPSGTLVKDRIVLDIKSTLEAIASPTNHTTVVSVRRYGVDNPFFAFNAQEFPAIIISPVDVTRSNTVAGELTCEMNLTARCMVFDRETFASELEWFAADVQQSLLVDHTRGGDAWDTHVFAEDIAQPEDVSGLAYVDVSIRVRFAHLYADPTTPI